MSLIEAVELLCTVTKLQADIIRKQAEALAQAEIADEAAEEFAAMRRAAAADLERINKEYN